MNDNEIITSRDNAKLKLARSVRDGREPVLIFVEGKRLASELFRSGLDVKHILISSDLALSDELDELREIPHVKRPETIIVAANLFASITDTLNSQGIIVLAERPIDDFESLSNSKNNVAPLILLHRVNNPANLGAIVRTAESAGAVGVITTSGSAAAFSPKAIRASMGSCFRLPIVEDIDFESAIEWARTNTLISTAADVHGSNSYSDIDWNVRRLLILGSEAHGLTEKELESIDEKIVIPMENGVESLNLAVSAGIILFEAKGKRG